MEKIGKKLKAREEELAREEKEEVGGSESIQDLVLRYRNILLGGLAAVVLVIIAGFGWKYFQGQREIEAGDAMFKAVNYFEVKDYQKALDGDSVGNMGFLDIIAEYGGTNTANMAKYYSGIIYLEQGNRAEGIDYLQDFSKGENMLSYAAYMALGFAYEDEGNLNEAASAFEDAAAAIPENDQTTPLALFHAGRLYEATGDSKKALDNYQTIKDAYPNSTEGRSIDKYIGRASQ